MMRNVLKVLTEVLAALANDSEMEVGQAAKDHAWDGNPSSPNN